MSTQDFINAVKIGGVIGLKAKIEYYEGKKNIMLDKFGKYSHDMIKEWQEELNELIIKENLYEGY